VFETGKIYPVCGNSWNMLQGNPKVAPHFQCFCNFEKHYGIFDGSGISMPYDRVQNKLSAISESTSGGGCC
jgi:arsenite methyltransferase